MRKRHASITDFVADVLSAEGDLLYRSVTGQWSTDGEGGVRRATLQLPGPQDARALYGETIQISVDGEVLASVVVGITDAFVHLRTRLRAAHSFGNPHPGQGETVRRSTTPIQPF